MPARSISRRPLWEMYIIEGLDGIEGFPKGCFGMVIKVHHAAIDGDGRRRDDHCDPRADAGPHTTATPF